MSNQEEHDEYVRKYQDEYDAIDQALDIEYMAYTTEKTFDEVAKLVKEIMNSVSGMTFDEAMFIIRQKENSNEK